MHENRVYIYAYIKCRAQYFVKYTENKGKIQSKCFSAFAIFYASPRFMRLTFRVFNVGVFFTTIKACYNVILCSRYTEKQ